jgi:hypothetical protein
MNKAPMTLIRRGRALAVLTLVAALATAAFTSTSAAEYVGRLLGGAPHAPAAARRAAPARRLAAAPAPRAFEQPAADSPFVTTDRTDYKPGDTVVIFGSGFAAGESVKLTIHKESSDRADTEIAAEADEYGNIVSKDFATTADDLGSSFTLTAAGQSSGRTSGAKFTDGGVMNYAPNSVSLTAFSGASGSSTTSFSQTVTAPSGNGNFQAPAAVASVSVGGSIPMPTSWVTVTGGTGNFVTGPANNPKNPPDSKTRTVSVTPAANTPPGVYTANVSAAPAAGSGVGVGQGTLVQLTVTSDNAPPTTTLSAVDAGNNTYNGVNFVSTAKVTITLTVTDAGGSGVSVTRYKVDNGQFKSYSGPFDIAGEGLSVVTYFSVDNTGAQETAQFFTVKIDRTAPSITCGTADGQWHANDVNIQCTAADAGGQQTSGLANPSDASFSLSTSVSPGAETNDAQTGTHDVCDNAGNCATAGPVGGNMVDKKAPVVSCAPDDGSWHANNVPITCTATDGGSGLGVGVTSPFTVMTSVDDGDQTDNAAINVPAIADAVGNVAPSSTINNIKVDRKAPAITASAVRADDNSQYNAGDWVNQNVVVSFQCNDTGGSGVASVDDAVTVSGEGANQSVTGHCADNLGHTAQVSFGPVNIDKTDPTLSFDSYSPAANGAGWNNTDVSVAFTPGDALSGVGSTSTASPLVLSAEGSSVTGSVTVTDAAGNSKTFTTSAVKIDKIAPTLSPARHAGSQANGAGWNNSAVTVDANAADSLSGVTTVSPSASQTVSTEGANQSVSFTATDAAGNSASASLGGINIDLTPPTVSATRSPAANGFGWNNTDVTASYAAGDSLSGLNDNDPANGSFVFTSEGSNQSHTFTVHDQAGNSNTATVNGVNIDKTAPAVTINAPTAGPYLLNQTAAASFGCSDGGNPPSGIDTCTGPVSNGGNFDTSSAGPHTFTVTAKDKAGNTASKSVTYGVVYDWSGYLQPINLDGSSVFKLGSTVPVKFRLVGGSAGVTSATNFTLWVAKVSNSIVGSEVEAVTSTPASTGNLFRYDPTSGQYIYNMGTKGAPWTAGAWQLRVDLGDGAPPRIVLISLKP